MPATAGGSTSGSSMSVTTRARPRNERVASRQAAGVPTIRMIAIEAAVVRRLSERVERARLTEAVDQLGRAAIDEDGDDRERQEGERDASERPSSSGNQELDEPRADQPTAPKPAPRARPRTACR